MWLTEQLRRIGRLRKRRGVGARLASNSVWTISGTAIKAAALFGETVLLAHYLSPAGFGTLLLLIAYPEAVQQLLDFRVRDAMTRYLGEALAKDRKAEAVAVVKLMWLVDVAVAAFAFVLVVVTSGIAADVLVDDGGLAHLMVIYAIGMCFASVDSASGPVLRVLDRFPLSFAASTFTAVLRIALIAAVVIGEGGLLALVWVRVIAEIVSTLLQGGLGLWALLGVVGEERGASVRLLKGRYREIGGFLASTNLAAVVRMASTKLDTILVGLLASTSTVGLYRVGVQFSKLPLLLGDALYSVVYPYFARAVANARRAEMRRVAFLSTAMVAGVLAPVALASVLFSSTLVKLVGGSGFGGAATALVICTLGVLPSAVTFWMPPLLLACGEARVLLKLSFIAVMAQMIAIVVLVPPLGANGAALAFALAYVLIAGQQLYVLRRRRLLEVPSVLPGEAPAPDGGRVGVSQP